MTKQAIYWFLAFAAFFAGAWLCLGQPVPPVPPKPKAPLLSPKDTSSQPIRLTVPLVVIPPMKTLVWTWAPNTDNPASNVVFIVRWTTNLLARSVTWPVAAVVKTNGYSFPASLPFCLYSVWASNTVTKLVSP